MKRYFLSAAIALMISSTFTFAQTRETREVEAFTKINFRFPGKLYVKQGSKQKVEIEASKDLLKEIETRVEGSRLSIGTEGKWSNWNWSNDEKITVYITIPEIEGLAVSGSGDIIGDGKLNVSDIDLKVSGSGSLEIDVEAKGEIEADVSGSGNVNLTGKCQRLNSDVSGSGDVELSLVISETADFGISGSGKIKAKGSADVVKASISGSGKVLAADLEANRCNVRISGSGDVEINVKNELDATIAGSGSVSYRGNPNKVNSHAAGSGKVRKM